ncbi:MAG TPA: ATP-binding cassette domain-containing protein [Pyrinomonadaceae bacterium]
MKIRKRFGNASKIESSATEAGAASRADFLLDVEFDAPPGVTILFGASGSGKSLTLKSIAGIIRPDEGRISVGERTLFDSARRINLPIRERKTGYVFQNLALFPHLSALGNVEFALPHLLRRERRERALDLLEAFGIRHTAERGTRDISGGEAQRLALARTLAGNPGLLLLDEPLSALDHATKLGIIDDLREINRRLRLPIIYVTHSRDEAVALGERAIVYEHGRIVARGEPLDVFASPVSAGVARLTGAENIFEARVVGRNEEGGTMTLEVGGASEGGVCRLEAPLGGASQGERVRVAIRSGDILLATVEPRSTSARNILRGQIESIEETGSHVRVRVRSGVRWTASVTREATRELKLKPDMEVWLAFKTYSCHLLDS